MPSDLEQLRIIYSQTLAIIAQLTSDPKPSYTVDGQTVSWSDYLAKLQETVDWCEKKLAGQEPFEIHSQGAT